MKEITLTQGQIALVDDEDFDAVSRLKWSARFCKCTHSFYATRTDRSKGSRTVLMHRFILNAAGADLFVDHINHDTLDNRRENLRLCSRAENCRNARKRSDGISRFKGVSWDAETGKWRARIDFNGKTINIGRFHEETDAAAAYDRKALELHGEFALTNF